MSAQFLLFLFVLLVIALPIIVFLWRAKSTKKPTSFQVFIKWAVLVIAFVFFFFLAAFYMQWLGWIWKISERVAHHTVALLFAIFLPLTAYEIFNLIDLIGTKIRPQKRWLLRFLLGIPMMLTCCLFLVHGFMRRHKLVVERIEIESERLPEKFNNTKIAVISDVHLGTLIGNKEAYLQAIVDSVKALHPDFVFLVGDLVSFRATEALQYQNFLQDLEAKVGKYAVMGNHDYGGYFPFYNEAELMDNEERMHDIYEACGFHMLRNEGIGIAYDDENVINIAGIECWGRGPFPKLGNLDEAMSNVRPSEFTILLSHDPSIWRPLVFASNYYVDLTVSGHTHGGQIVMFGISPAMLNVEFWSGLYREGNQYIYVSRGVGYTSIPMRIGNDPEVTLIELKKSNESAFTKKQSCKHLSTEAVFQLLEIS